MNSPALKIAQAQGQILTPRLQLAVRLLQLSALDYEQELHEMVARNPFLEMDEFAEGAQSAPSELDRHTDETGSTDPQSDADVSDAGNDGSAWEEAELWQASTTTARDEGSTSQMSATDLMVGHIDLRQHLHAQARLLRLTPRDLALVGMLIESLDEDGYCRTDFADFMGAPDFDPPIEVDELNIALRLVQSFEPAGVGARNLQECLLLQLEKIDPFDRDAAQCIATHHLDRLAQGDVQGIAKSLGCHKADADAACAALRGLDPRPGLRFSPQDTRYVVPDVSIRKIRGEWVAQLNRGVMPRVRLNRTCADLFQRHRAAGQGELSAHLQEARWAVRNIEQRFATILSVAQAILRRQRLFFQHGPLAMKPLALRDIAMDVGIHESTVCRVTNNKFIATPFGLFELKHFFSRAMPMSTGGACSATAIRSVVKELIDAEDPFAPLSDVDLAQHLARQGLKVARRTVTKYRQTMKIAPAERRRRYASDVGIAAVHATHAMG